MTVEALEQAFEKRRSEFVENHAGEWVLLFENGDARFFEIENDAVSSGMRDRRGLGFVVKQALSKDPVITLSSAVLAGQVS